MRQTIIALAMILTVTAAKAAPFSLSCDPVVDDNPHFGVIRLTIDLANNTVTIDDGPYMITSASPSIITANSSEGRFEEALTLDRATGKLSYRATYQRCESCIILKTFVCKPAGFH